MIKQEFQKYEVRCENTYETIAIFDKEEEAISYLKELKNNEDYYISTPSGENIYL